MEILFYRKKFNKNFSIADRLRIAEIPDVIPSHVKVSFSQEETDLEKADVVVFDIPFTKKEYSNRKKPDCQIWVGWLLESVSAYPWIKNIKDKFDFILSYELDADITIPFFNYNFLTELRTPPIEKTKNICCFIKSSTNQSKRLQYVDELEKYISIDYFGRNQNREIKDRHYLTKQKVSSQYYFTIAFENSIYDDFITEKFFDPLLVGSIPLYLGADNIEKFAPADNCYINAKNYSPRELADLLNELIEDKDKYNVMLEWKQKPFREDFVTLLESQKEHFILRLIKKIEEK